MIDLIFFVLFCIFMVGLFVLLVITIKSIEDADKDNSQIVEKKKNSHYPYRTKLPETKQEPLSKQYWFKTDGEKECYWNGKEVLVNIDSDEDNIQMKIILPKIKIRQ